MNDNPKFDARAIANLLLDEAEGRALVVTNLMLQKLLYFTHGAYLTANRAPLVDGYFEAWTHGPVHPNVYQAFKEAGSSPITWRAVRSDYTSGRLLVVPPVSDAGAVAVCRRVVNTLGSLSASQLVALSHVPGGPWDVVSNEARTNPGRGMRISDMLVLERFSRHKLSVESPDDGVDPDQEAPFT
ncbi:MAG: DUF4065 domain-containing protein [Phenylobacterium sp.]|uniref:type VI toxin-antitoxin system SocA family antitoxin n=1 Tax=Phenylobacterium sp. TaxID=1871053 RepID=UPI002732B141|nr:type II toxin-antitoxin system antitoxin SocA domain-containing protein [Phenylobacterium sp.]MDP3117975.1 DUF4065 domain-containing protein [Phenylobacterium sp.]